MSFYSGVNNSEASYHQAKLFRVADEMKGITGEESGRKYIHLTPNQVLYHTENKSDKLKLKELVKLVQTTIEDTKRSGVFTKQENKEIALKLSQGLEALKGRVKEHKDSLNGIKKFFLRLIGIDYGKEIEKIEKMQKDLDNIDAHVEAFKIGQLQQKIKGLESEKEKGTKLLKALTRDEGQIKRQEPQNVEEIQKTKQKLEKINQEIQSMQEELKTLNSSTSS